MLYHTLRDSRTDSRTCYVIYYKLHYIRLFCIILAHARCAFLILPLVIVLWNYHAVDIITIMTVSVDGYSNTKTPAQHAGKKYLKSSRLSSKCVGLQSRFNANILTFVYILVCAKLYKSLSLYIWNVTQGMVCKFLRVEMWAIKGWSILNVIIGLWYIIVLLR